MDSSVFVNALNVRSGGGRRLLDEFLGGIDPQDQYTIAVDSDFHQPEISNVRWVTRPAGWIHRMKAEFNLRSEMARADWIFSFNNLPPIWSFPKDVFVFVQNRQIFDNPVGDQLSFGARVRLAILRTWIRVFTRSHYTLVVQTPSMQKVMTGLKTVCLPFAATFVRHAQPKQLTGLNDAVFIYPTDASPHKNFRRLIPAWRRLADRGAKPKLILTVAREEFTEDELKGLDIEFVPKTTFALMDQLYARSTHLIFPSLCESFGLPLVEAAQLGLTIVASERDFIRDVCEPAQTFDPLSSDSIADAVMSGWNKKSRLVTPLLSGQAFLRKLQELRA